MSGIDMDPWGKGDQPDPQQPVPPPADSGICAVCGQPSDNLSSLGRCMDCISPDHQAYLASSGPTDAELAEMHPQAKQKAKSGKDEPAPAYARSWRPVDLTSVLDGTWQPPKPTIGLRGDGIGLFYPGKVHTVASETEAGKTWLALIVVAEQLRAGAHVAYVDFEDDEGTIVDRLRILQVDTDTIAKQFHYLRPDVALGTGINLDDLRETLALGPSVVIIDGITAAMSLFGLDPLSNKDVAQFIAAVPKRAAASGAAVLCLDHVTKASEGRGRYALGAAHKLNGLTGAAYLLDNHATFGIEKTGRSTIRVGKDRPGQVRRHGLPAKDNTHWVADLVLDSHDAAWAEGTIEVPEPRAEDWQPTILMERISTLLDGQTAGLSQNTIESKIGGKATNVRLARAQLTIDGYVTDTTPYKLIKPFHKQGSR